MGRCGNLCHSERLLQGGWEDEDCSVSKCALRGRVNSVALALWVGRSKAVALYSFRYGTKYSDAATFNTKDVPRW